MVIVINRSSDYFLDNRLTLEDKGLLSLLLVVENKAYSKNDLASLSADDVDVVENSIYNLIKYGYVRVAITHTAEATVPDNNIELWLNSKIKWSYTVDGSGGLNG